LAASPALNIFSMIVNYIRILSAGQCLYILLIGKIICCYNPIPGGGTGTLLVHNAHAAAATTTGHVVWRHRFPM